MMPVDGHLQRIEREAGVPGLVEALAQLAPADLKSLLLRVFEHQAARRDPSMLLAQYERDGTVGAAPANHAVDAAALRAAEGFEPVELAPVAPLGLNAVLGRIHQNNVLSTIRNTEVLADPTASLALEAAVRRRNGETSVRLCAPCLWDHSGRLTLTLAQTTALVNERLRVDVVARSPLPAAGGALERVQTPVFWPRNQGLIGGRLESFERQSERKSPPARVTPA